MIVLDEPTNGLDPKAREEIRNLIRSLPERFQTTVMISSHALDEIEKMVTKIGIIGKLLPMWSDQKVAGAIERLVRAGIAVYRVMEVTQSLEELFLDFTESDSL